MIILLACTLYLDGLVCDGAAIHLFCDSGVAGLLLARSLFDLWEANFLFAGKIS